MTDVAEPGSVRSALRVFEILELFRVERRPLRLKDFTTSLNLPASTTSGLLKTMAGQGYLSWNQSSRTYFPTPRLGHLAAWVPGVAFEATAVTQAMHNLHRATGELIVLGAPNDIHVEYLEAIRSTHGIQLWTPPGTRLPMINLGMGWLFLSRMTAQDAHHIWHRTMESGLLRPSDVPEAELNRKIITLSGQDVLFTHTTSYKEGLHPGHPGGGMISAIIQVPRGHRQLAIGLGGPEDRLEEKYGEYSAALARELTILAEYAQG
jgi:DNA-binding IclR family transcriptional regulator